MNLIVLPSVDSTNNYLQALLNNNPIEEGTVVLGLEQTKGRGQRGNSWLSLPADGLYASILFLPANFPVENQYLLNKAIACGTARYIESKTSEEVKIKWPNDIMINGKKVAGILIENNIRGNHVSAIIAGIGINLNQSSFEADFNTPPTSLRMVSHLKYHPEEEVGHLFQSIWSDYQRLLKNDGPAIKEDYRRYLFLRGEASRFEAGNESFIGVLLDVDENGAALIEVDGDMRRCFHPHTRHLLRKSE